MSIGIESFSKDLKLIVRGFYRGGEIVEDGCVFGYPPTKAQQRLCFKLTHLALDYNGLFKPDTKNWLLGTEVFSGSAKNYNTSRSRIQYDLKKLRLALGNDALAKISRNREGFEDYEVQIDDLLKKYQNRSLVDKLIFRVRHEGVEPNSGNLTENDKIALLEIFETYSKAAVKRAEESMSVEMIAYLKYIESNQDSLSSEDREILDAIKSSFK